MPGLHRKLLCQVFRKVDAVYNIVAIITLEHGGIWISYKDVDANTKAKLENLTKRFPNSVIITPRASNNSKIVLASWSR